jgi:hypothetical protein
VAPAQWPQATVTAAPAAPRAEVRPEVRREKAVVVDRSRQRQADRSRKGGFNALWLLPLRLLPLAAVLLRNTEEEALLHTQDTAIEVRLSGRHQNDWAQLAESSWIKVESLSRDPRGTAVKSHS